MGDGLLETHRTTEARRRRGAGRQGESRAGGELARPRDVAFADPLPAPVELGRGLRRNRATPRGTRIEPRRSSARCSPGQWRDGLLPHIVFTDGARYFPGPEFWQTERSPAAPKLPKTSGIVQPPIHGSAALQVYRLASDRERGAAFLEELLPKLAAWHAYLYRERARSDGGLVEIWHPWESGMDNSPLWDAALERMAFDADQLPEYQRVDVELADATERPSDGEYDRYVYLVDLFRELSYDSSRIRDVVPFAIQPVLFNSLLVQSNRDLAEIARIVGADPAPFESWAESTAAALDETLWDEEHAVYVDYDVREGAPVGARTAAGLAPLYAGVPTPARAAQMVEVMAGSRVAVGEAGWAITSQAPARPGLPACPLLARPDLAHPELGAPARARSLRVPGARRRRSPCAHRAGAKRRFPRALQPRDGSRPGWRGVRVDGSARSRSPERERAARAGGATH